MRAVFSYTAIIVASILTVFSSFASNRSPNTPSESNVRVIYGLSNTEHFNAASSGQFYVQAASFKNIKNANIYKKELTNKFHQRVAVKARGSYYVVRIGPLRSAAEVRALSGTSPKVVQKVESKALKHKSKAYTRTFFDDKSNLNPTAYNHFVVIGAIGIASLDADDGYLGVTSSETDQLVQTNGSRLDAFTAQLGFGYVYYFLNYAPSSDHVQWFTAFEPQLNGYYLGQNSIKGDVLRFGNPNFNDMTYDMPIDSYRIMLDGVLTVISKRQYSLYAIGGMGNAWNTLGYRDTDRNGMPCADLSVSLNNSTHSSLSWEVGAGLSYAINKHLSLSLEYLYADLGTLTTSGSGLTGSITTPALVPANFELTSQAALLGLRVAL